MIIIFGKDLLFKKVVDILINEVMSELRCGVIITEMIIAMIGMNKECEMM